MGFYIRKALSVGPFRFNLSKSGLGVSVGIKGLRLGAGPRGNYVHMGREGLYFRKSLHSPGASLPARRRLVEPETSRESLDHENLSASVGPMHEIESGPVEQMVDASSAELLRELNEKKRKTRILPPTIAASLVGALILLFSKTVPNWVVVAFVFFAAVLCWLARVKDDLRKTTVVLYDLEPDVEAAYAMLHEAFQRLRSCSKIWHIEARGAVKDSKYHAGATGIVQRKGIRPTVGAPPFVKTNIEVPIIPVGRQILAFMPDRLLVFDSTAVGAAGYQQLQLEVTESQFVEEESVPKDAVVVGRTWRYVNKKGGPDRRFKDNYQIPICSYEQLRFSSETGLNEVVQVSRRSVGEDLRKALSVLARFGSQEVPCRPLVPA